MKILKQIFFITMALLFGFNSFTQTIESDYIVGAWSDTTISKIGDGFIFSPDGCLSFITKGEPTECIIENQNLKVHYRVNYHLTPKQLEILLINLKTDSIIGIIPMIFEIIDDNNIKLATYKTKSTSPPIDFSQREDVEIEILTRYSQKQK